MNRKPKILVVDDAPELLQAQMHLLEKAGYHVIGASTGREALNQVRLEKPDLVLLDVVLPNIDGREVCRQIKEDPALSGVFVVLLSGVRTSPEEKSVGFEAGADGYIARPVANQEMLAQVEAVLRIQRAKLESEQSLQALKESQEKIKTVLDMLPVGVSILDDNRKLRYYNPALSRILDISEKGLAQGSYTKRRYVRPDGTEMPDEAFASNQALKNNAPVEGIVTGIVKENGEIIWTKVSATPIPFPDWRVLISTVDITAQRSLNEELKKIEWLLAPGKVQQRPDSAPQPYGDLTELNTNRTILDAVGSTILQDIVDDFLHLLDTSAAVYEANGDYAEGLFASSWCRFMDNASRELCSTEDNRQALQSGQWHCHESCWMQAAKPSIINRQPVDVPCLGGIRLYAVPIFAHGKAIGSIDFGYGDPPTDPVVLEELSERYRVSPDDLLKRAREYDSRPQYIIEMAKKRVQASARMIGVLVERAQFENNLKQSQEQLQLVMEATQDGFFDWHIPSNKITFNPAYFQMLGYEPYELPHTFDTYRSLVHPEDKKRSQDQLNRYLSGQSGENAIEMRFKTKEGHWKWLLSRGKVVEYDQEGKPLRFVGTNIDIDARKAMEADLRQERDRAQLYLDIAGVMFIALDERGRITLVNQKACQVLEVAEADLLGRDWFETCLPARLRQDVREVYHQLMRGEVEPVEFYENPVVTSTGEERLIAWHNSALLDESGKISGVISSGEDITDRKRAEEERTQVLKQLETKNRELESFVYTVSHDLKSPLVSISGFAASLQNNYSDQLEQRGRHYLDRLQSNVAHLENLITELLELSRVGRVVGELVPVEVEPLLNQVLDTLSGRLDRSGGEVIIQTILPTVEADRTRLSQVFANLLDNAIKFRAESRPLRIEIGCRESQGDFHFYVRDNGIGIDSRYTENIFIPFQKLHSEAEGSGVGLALVNRIIQYHHGKVWFESQPGVGSTFFFSLPKPKTKKNAP